MKQTEFTSLIERMDEVADTLPKFVGAIPIDDEGTILPTIVPGCLVYIACGESTLLRVGTDMAFDFVSVEANVPLQSSAKPEPKRLRDRERPSNCTMRLREEGKPSPKSGCHVCNHGGMFGCPYDKQSEAERGRVPPLDNK